MKIQNIKSPVFEDNLYTAVIYQKTSEFPEGLIHPRELKYLEDNPESETIFFRYPGFVFLYQAETIEDPCHKQENARKAGASLFRVLEKKKGGSLQLINTIREPLSPFFLEGFILASYAFTKYKKEKENVQLTDISVVDPLITGDQLLEVNHLTEAVFFARDLVNEPLSTLTAVRMAEEFQRAGDRAGFSVEIFGIQKIKSLKMGGLLAVNKGSIDPPTFSVLEWKPEGCRNNKPVVLVGKGIVFDTGGLSLKSTPNSMDTMKSDMGGGAAVAATLYALAKNQIPVHVIGLIPATDNRPDGNAYAPGDIITLYDGTSVEIKNTDAEGRLILADALGYAKKYEPELVIDVATLTGTASLITGINGLAAMGTDKQAMVLLKKAGDEVYERIIELPLWEEFAEPLKSPVADLNNLGVREGQASIAGKFLEHFTGYPWIHMDIAGSAFITENKDYRKKGGTGVGTRLLFNFLKNYDPKKNKN